MPRWIERITVSLIVLGLAGLAITWWAVQQTQQIPTFYSEASLATSKETVEASRALEDKVEQLQSSAAKRGSWRAGFSDSHINAWLLEELPKKFPRLLASGASEPRIVIENGRVLAAVRYQNGRIDTVISCEIEVKLTEQPNMLALHVQKLKAGALPLPLNKFLSGISKEASRGEIDVHWDMTESGPIALVTVPSEDPRYVLSPVIVESVRLVSGSLMLSGHTGSLAHQSYRPIGPVYQFVSYRPTKNRKVHVPSFSSLRDSESRVVR